MADAFDYRTASEEEILAKARQLRGKRLGDIPEATFEALTAGTGRGEVGHAIEAFFGIPRNSRSMPDFPGARIELKVVPLRRTGRGLGVKERTVISLIDYMALIEETWPEASVRKKLKILFVFFEHIDEQPKSTFPIREVLLWEPDARTDALLRADWERVFTKVRQGRAHELSESDGAIMGPCTKSATSLSRRPQPFGDPARPRAWALKPSFTWRLYRAITKPMPAVSLLEGLGPNAAEQFETRLLDRFSPFVGRTVEDVGAELGVPQSDAKSYAAAVVRRIFGAKSLVTKIVEFEEMGLTPRITRVDDSLMPYEALSFPAFRYHLLLEETWEDSDLLARIEYMLLVAVHGQKKATPQKDCTLGVPVFWRPSAGELDLIRREWEIFRLEIREGRANRLTPASQTVAIHVRPHSRDARDTDDAPSIGPVVKKSFWLNRPFVREILRGGAEGSAQRR